MRALDLRGLKSKSWPSGTNVYVHWKVNVVVQRLVGLMPLLEVLRLSDEIALAESTMRALIEMGADGREDGDGDGNAARDGNAGSLEEKLTQTQIQTQTKTKTKTKTKKNKLKVLTGVQVIATLDQFGRDPLSQLFIASPNLLVLSIRGGGSTDIGFEINEFPQPPLTPTSTPASIPSRCGVGTGPDPGARLGCQLQKLTLNGVKRSLLLQGLLRSQLPHLHTLELTCYNTSPGDLTVDFLRVHGRRLRNLTFLPLPDWPKMELPIPESVLIDCPKLERLSLVAVLPPSPKMLVALYEDVNEEDATSISISQTSPQSSPPPTFSPTSPSTLSSIKTDQRPRPHRLPTVNHPLHTLIIPRWTSSRDHSPQDLPDIFYSALTSFTPPNLRFLVVADFVWVKKDLGRVALETGLNGKLRKVASQLKGKGVKVVDKNGDECPLYAVGVGVALGGGVGAEPPATNMSVSPGTAITKTKLTAGQQQNTNRMSGSGPVKFGMKGFTVEGVDKEVDENA